MFKLLPFMRIEMKTALIIIGCILVISGIITFAFYQWLKIKRILENPDEVEIDYQIYIESDDNGATVI